MVDDYNQVVPGSIRLNQISAGYGKKQVLEALSLEFPARQISAMAGPGGSGKTTLLRVLGNWSEDEFWRRGSVEVCSVNDCSPLRLQTQWQKEPDRNSGLSALIRPEEPGASPKQVQETIHEIWQDTPEAVEALLEAMSQPQAAISPWCRRLATITGNLSLPADLRLFDEPAVDFPESALHWLTARLKKAAAEATIVLVTHNLGFARQVADYMVLVADGQLIETGTTQTFFEKPSQERTRHFVRFGS